MGPRTLYAYCDGYWSDWANVWNVGSADELPQPGDTVVIDGAYISVDRDITTINLGSGSLNIWGDRSCLDTTDSGIITIIASAINLSGGGRIEGGYNLQTSAPPPDSGSLFLSPRSSLVIPASGKTDSERSLHSSTLSAPVNGIFPVLRHLNRC